MMIDNASLTFTDLGIYQGGLDTWLNVDSFQFFGLGSTSSMFTFAPATQLLNLPSATFATTVKPHDSGGGEEESSIWETVNNVDDDVFIRVIY